MNIKRSLAVIGIGVFLLVGGLGLTYLHEIRQHRAALGKMIIAEDIVSLVFQRRLIADEYIASPTERAVRQREIAHAKLMDMVGTYPITHPGNEEDRAITTLRTSLDDGQKIFESLINLNGASESADSEFTSEQQIRTAALLSVKAQQAIAAAGTLENVSRQEILESSRHLSIIFTVIGVLLVCVLSFSFWLIWKSANELETSKNRIEAILAGIGDGVVMMGTDRIIRVWNRAAEDITGWASRESVGSLLSDRLVLLQAHDRTAKYDFIDRTIETKQTQHLSEGTVLVRKDGRDVPVGDSAAPVFGVNGDIQGVVIVFRDIAKELESRSLHSEFAYASHQLRTPVTKSLGFLEIAMNSSKSDPVKNELAIAYQSLLSTAKVVEQMIAVSEIGKGFAQPKMHRFDLTALIAKITKKLKSETGSDDIQIYFSQEDEKWEVVSAENLMTRIISELIHNAISYNKPGGTIDITVEKDQSSVIIGVKDSGIGIEKEEKNLVGTKFFRGSNFNTTEIAGAGLGIFIAKAFAEKLGGKIWFTSAESGSEFYFSFPETS